MRTIFCLVLCLKETTNEEGILYKRLSIFYKISYFLGLTSFPKVICSILFFIIFLVCSAFCQNSPRIINKTPDVISLNTNINVLQHHEVDANINEVLEISPNQWVPLHALPNKYEEQKGWFKISLNTEILVDGLIIYLPLVSRAEAYIVQGNKIKAEFKGGEFVNADKKAILSDRTSFVIPLYNVQKGIFHVYIKVENLKNNTIDFNWQLRHFSDWIWEYYYISLKDILFLTINFVLILIAILLFLFLKRRRSYLYYAGYILGTLIYFTWDAGYTANYLFGSFPKFNFSLKVTQHLAPICYILFLYGFKYKRRVILNKIFIGAILINAVFALFVLVWIFREDTFEIMLAHMANAISGVSMLLVSIVFLFNFKVNKVQHYLASGGVSIVVLSYLVTIVFFYLGAANFKIYFQIGFLIEISMFTLGLVFQFRRNELNKVEIQNNLIKELRKNKLLQENYNNELEIKVAERTEEIAKKNEEIVTHRNELLENSNELKELNTELVAQSEIIHKANERHYKNEKILKKAYEKLKRTQHELHLKNESIRKINKNQEKIIASRNRGIIKAKAELDEFLYRTSHNLKGPVARIKGLKELLKIELSGNENTKEYLDRLGRVIEKMEALFHKLNAVSVIHKTDSRDKAFDLSEIIATVVKEQKKEIERANAVVIEDTLSVMMAVNPKIITIIVEFLLQNSLQFRDKERELKVEIHLSKQDKLVRLAIKDNGTGIPADIMNHIFDMFYIGSLDSEGDGLGLYIVRKAIIALNGFINVESEYTKGTTVSITLPITYNKDTAETDIQKAF